ncbi:hypothetical protein [Nonomuraea sp. NPDC050540]|uniref:hypothetical protein n=1 Tax=Nonomuraea sp. NPDC050540 TaxID=3364367 RepID=UPI00378AE0D5
MGNFYDYYRAPDRDAAVVRPDMPRAIDNSVRHAPVFDSVDAKWIDPQIILGQLIAFVRDVPFTLDLVSTAVLYPPPEGAPRTVEELDALPESSPYREGPEIDELTSDVRDTLAGIPDERLAELGQQWAQVEEFIGTPDPEYLATLIEELRGLARRAQDEQQMIYCWMSI